MTSRNMTLEQAYNRFHDYVVVMGLQPEAITETDQYTIYKIEAGKQTIEMHFYHDEDRAIEFVQTWD